MRVAALARSTMPTLPVYLTWFKFLPMLACLLAGVQRQLQRAWSTMSSTSVSKYVALSMLPIHIVRNQQRLVSVYIQLSFLRLVFEPWYSVILCSDVLGQSSWMDPRVFQQSNPQQQTVQATMAEQYMVSIGSLLQRVGLKLVSRDCRSSFCRIV